MIIDTTYSRANGLNETQLKKLMLKFANEIERYQHRKEIDFTLIAGACKEYLGAYEIYQNKKAQKND